MGDRLQENSSLFSCNFSTRRVFLASAAEGV